MARILLGLLFLQIFTLVYSQCRDGWQEQFGNCYLFVNVRRSHNGGASICERYGSKLANPKNVSELNYLNGTATNEFKNANPFWLGYSKGQDNDLDRYWDNSQPNSSEGNCVAMNNLGLFMVDNCFWQHFFVCQRKACGQNEYSCVNGDCVPSTNVCDKREHCSDSSDEINCPNLSSYFYNSLSDKISVNASVFRNQWCQLSVKVPTGYRIIMELQLNNEKKDGVLWIHGIKKNKVYFLWNMRDLSGIKLYSRTNFVIVKFQSDNKPDGTVFDFHYTSIAISSLILQATHDPKELSFPESWMMFPDLELSWKIEAAKGSAITLQLFELVFPNSGRNSFYIWYGDDMAVNLTDSTKNQTFTSNTSEVFIYFYSANDDRNASLNLTYQMLYCVSAGYEIGPSRNECILCTKGFYKNATAGVEEKCSQCPQNFTTSLNQGATTLEDCNLKICLAGEFRNSTSNMCQDCNEGYYQPNVERGECLKCPENHTTLSNKSKRKEDCIFYCALSGYEIGPSRNECIPCAKGFYKKATAGVEEKCSRCPQNFTTSLNQGATTVEDCDLFYCASAGYEVGPSRNECIPCAKGFYKKATAGVEEKCSRCPQNFTTSLNQGATTVEDCDLFYCASAGYEVGPSRNECIPCAKGFYKKATAGVEEKCSRCPQNFTTSLNQGATTVEDCDLFYCASAGYEVGPSRNECISCAKGFYKKAAAEVEEKCSRCPQNFTTSLNQGATTLEDCDFKLCLEGEFRNNISNTCQDCNKGYYQPNVEKSDCFKCSDNRTTISTKSQRKEDCILECLAGYVYNRSSDACMECPKGTYKSEMGYHPCIACTGIMTTFSNASTRETDCRIPNCPAGEEPTGDYLSCKKCSLGYYKSDSSSIHCIQCPTGTTTLQTGATSVSQCPKKIVRNPAILNTVVIVILLQYSFVNCEMNQAFYEGEIKSAMEKRIEEISKVWSLCIGYCLVMVNVNCPTSNRKKRATEIGNAEVQVGNVKSNADSKTKDERTFTENIFTQDCKVNQDEYQVNSAQLMSCAVSTSCRYSKLVSNKCVFCPAGTKAIETGCVDCPKGTYSGTNQRECTNCRSPLTSKSRSNSSSQCLSECLLDSTYCKNGGICSKSVNYMHHICSCSKKFSGDQCEIYNEPYGKWWIFVIIGCIGLILVIIQIVAVSVKCSRKKHKEKTRIIRRAGDDHSAEFFYGSPMQGHRANQPFVTNWNNIRKLSY